MPGLTFSSKLDWSSNIISIAKTVFNKIGVLIRSMKLLSPEVTLYLYKYTMRPCMEYVVTSGLVPLVATRIVRNCLQIYRTVGPSLAASLETFARLKMWPVLSLFYRYYFGRCSSELAQLIPLPFSRGRSTCFSDRLHIFSVAIPRCYKDIYVNSFFYRTARL